MKKRLKNDSGYSLVEMIIVIAIIGNPFRTGSIYFKCDKVCESYCSITKL